MNKITTIILFVCFSFSLTAQIWEENLIKTNKNPNSKEKFEAFEKYRELNPYTKGNGYNPYARQMDFINKRIANSHDFNPNALYIEWKKEKYAKNKENSASNWISMGPSNTPIIMSNGKKRGNGRVNCIAFDPINPNIIWIGSPSGGLWKSIDGGSNWTTNTDNLPVMGVSHIAIDPNNNQIMYIVTGDTDASDTYSIGILKSINGGATWDTTGLSYNVNQTFTVNKIIINPNFTDSLYAITDLNILISSDAGASWQITGPMGRWRDIELKPDNSNVIYAAKQSSGNGMVYRSEDGGINWSIINNPGGCYRPLIAVTPDNPDVIYAVYTKSDDSFYGLYKSSDAGDTWVIQSNSPNILAWDTDGSGSGGQSWYDLSLGVSTNNENLVYVGGVNIWRSDNSGINWNIDASSGNGSNYSYMHVDQHAFEFNPHTHVAYAGNDGGVYKYMEILNSWVNISDGLEITQFYNLGLSKSDPSMLIAGTQDNGTELLTGGTWDAIMGGDGMECAIDHYNKYILYAEYQYGGLRKSYNGGLSWDPIKPVNYEGGWNTPYEMHPINNNLLVIGYDEVYRTTSGGVSWDTVSPTIGDCKSIALASSDENYIYVSTQNSIKLTKNAGVTWDNISSGLPGGITDIEVATNNPDRAWVTFPGYNNLKKVYETNDAGNSWVNISGNNLPSLPVNCIVYQGGANDDLYIGTDVGVYYKDNSMTEWTPYNNGLPNVVVRELEIHYDEGTISAATYGRGVWESPLNTLSSVSTDNIESFNYSIFPNPAKNQITISPKTNDITVSIYTITGNKILVKNSHVINVSDLAKGCYIIQIKSHKNVFRNKLIIK